MAKLQDVPELDGPTSYSSSVRKSVLIGGNFTHVRDVTTSDATEFAEPSILKIPDGETDFKITAWGDEDADAVTDTVANDGDFYPVFVKKVWATGTSATDIKRYY